MTDIVERLRFDAARCGATFSKGAATNIEEAADEIERLRGELLALQNTNVWHLRAKMAEEKLSRYEQSMSCKDCGATEPSHKPDCPQLA